MANEYNLALGDEIPICWVIRNHGKTGGLSAWRSDAFQQPRLAGVARRFKELMSIAFVGF